MTKKAVKKSAALAVDSPMNDPEYRKALNAICGRVQDAKKQKYPRRIQSSTHPGPAAGDQQ